MEVLTQVLPVWTPLTSSLLIHSRAPKRPMMFLIKDVTTTTRVYAQVLVALTFRMAHLPSLLMVRTGLGTWQWLALASISLLATPCPLITAKTTLAGLTRSLMCSTLKNPMPSVGMLQLASKSRQSTNAHLQQTSKSLSVCKVMSTWHLHLCLHQLDPTEPSSEQVTLQLSTSPHLLRILCTYSRRAHNALFIKAPLTNMTHHSSIKDSSMAWQLCLRITMKTCTWISSINLEPITFRRPTLALSSSITLSSVSLSMTWLQFQQAQPLSASALVVKTLMPA